MRILQHILIKKIANDNTNAINLLIPMVIDELSKDMQLPASELLPKFIVLKTGKLLYDESSKLR